MVVRSSVVSFVVVVVVVVVVGGSFDDGTVQLNYQNRRFPSRGKTHGPVFTIDDDLGLGRVFDGIGAISGGGPGFGAALQILKVEIGGDSQSSDGSESSHMHTATDQNYDRGYEWWLMKEAKKRNPSIKLYGLPWTFPGWVGSGVRDPFKNSTATAYYILNWINGAARHHNLTIDYIGVWNERNCDPGYVKLLRRILNANGHSHIMMVVPDAMDWSIVDKLVADKDFLDAVDIIGQHYPGAFSPESARKLGKRLWASEEYSTTNSLSGGGCWARVLNESPVNAEITSFMAWNLIASYYDGFSYTQDGLMSANEPWSGHYVVSSPIWMTAHHTQFYFPGWSYLLLHHGLGNLAGNGTYIALTSPDRKHLTIVIETMTSSDSPCTYPMPKVTVADEQEVTLTLGGTFKSIKQLYVWHSILDFTGDSETILFNKMAPISIVDQKIHLTLKKNEVYTLTTLPGGQKGDHGPPPGSKPFPDKFSEDFEKYDIGSEPPLLSQQSGAFEITDSGDKVHGKVATQVVTEAPVDTCLPTVFLRPANVFGDFRWKNVVVGFDVLLDNSSPGASTGVYLGSQVVGGGCPTVQALGIYFWVSVGSHVARLTSSQEGNCQVFAEVALMTLDYGNWFNMRLDVQNHTVSAYLNQELIIRSEIENLPSQHGFVAFGPENFGVAHFDNLILSRAEIAPKETWDGSMENRKKMRGPMPDEIAQKDLS